MAGDKSLMSAKSSQAENSFVLRVVKATLIVAGIVTLLLICWYAIDVLMLIFASVLVGVFLRGLSSQINTYTGIQQKWSLLIVLTVLGALIGLAVWFLAARVILQLDYLAKQLPLAFATVTSSFKAYDWGNRFLAEMPTAMELVRGQGTVLGRITGVFSGVLGALLNVVIVIVLGSYLAAEPRLYSKGLASLVPARYRNDAEAVIEHISITLRRWLVGRMILMFVNGALTAVGLWFLGIPLALTLGLLAGLLNFIPNFGPLIAAVPAIMFALTIGPQTALYVGLLYLVVQSLDGFVLTPLVNRRSVALPPGLTISAQILLGVLVGGMGILLAGPLTAVLVVVVRQLSAREVPAYGTANKLNDV